MVDHSPLTMQGFVPILFGHAAFQQLNAGRELGLFEFLERFPEVTTGQIAEGIGLGPRATGILLMGTTSLGLTVKKSDRYTNCEIIADAFKNGSWQVLRDIVEFQAKISYIPASDYAESLRTGENVGIRHFPGDTRDLYSRLAHTGGLEQLFYRCMNSWSTLSNPVLIKGVDYTDAQRILDIGGGDAVNAIALASAHPHLRITVLDRPSALTLANEKIVAAGLADRIDTYAADLFDDEYPTGYDCLLFANQLVIWGPEQNKTLLAKARQAMVDGDRILIFSAFSDDDGTGPLYAALDNVYFSTLPLGGSTLYRWCEYESWLRACGFTSSHRITSDTWLPHGVIEAHAA
jgi:L-tyrosine C(3)-methyltransferase